jgi:hypothetical protein
LRKKPKGTGIQAGAFFCHSLATSDATTRLTVGKTNNIVGYATAQDMTQETSQVPSTPGPIPATRKVLMPETTQVMTQVRKNGKAKLAYRAGSLGKPKKVVWFVGMARMVCANSRA